jgi:hypothetical protein
VKFPEFSLFVGSECSDSRRAGEFVVSQREVLEDKFHFFGISLEHLLE